jgi:zinc transport system ATP-binding protein
LILDEPDTFVDNRFEHELYDNLVELNKEVAILLVSHDVGTISSYIKTIACVNGNLHYHSSNKISSEQLKVYNCPIDIITHGRVPHRVLDEHKH